MTRPCAVDRREPMVRAVAAGAARRATAAKLEVSPSCVVKLLQRWRRAGTLGPAPAGGGRRPELADHAERVHALLAATPDLTIAELLPTRAAASSATSRSAPGRLLEACGLTRKKDRARRRAGAPGGRRRAARLAGAAAGAAPRAAGAHRRDLGDDRDDAAPWPRPARAAGGRRRPASPLQDHDLPRRAAPRRPERARRARRRARRRALPRRRRAGAGAEAARGRSRGDGQPRRPQGRGGQRGDRRGRRAGAPPAARQPRPQPDRAGLRQAQQVFAKLKSLRRSAAARTVEALWRVIGQPLDAFSPEERANHLAHAGYVPSNREML